MQADDLLQILKANMPEAEIVVRDMVGDGDHFEIKVGSQKFQGKSLVDQHRMVHQALNGLAGGAVHAVKIVTYIPSSVSR